MTSTLTWMRGRALLRRLVLVVLVVLAALHVVAVVAVPESSNVQVNSHCACALVDEDGESACAAAACATATAAAECAARGAACLWRDTATQNRLAAHTDEFGAPRIVTVAPGVHVAVGFGLANAVLVEGPGDGAFVVDTLESVRAAAPVRAAFDALLAASGRRIVALVYTHGHTDHTYGAAAFATPEDIERGLVTVYAHASLPMSVRDGSLVTGALYQRSQRQFGTYLATGPDGHLNSGIGPGLAHDNSSLLGYLRPTVTFTDRLDTVIAGVNVTLLHTPGETSDHTLVHLRDLRVGMVGDNIYAAFPNLYSIRGTRARSVRTWFQSIDAALDLDLAVLVPSHTQPVVGTDAVRELLLTYRDGMQYVHDQTLRLLNLGFSTEEIVDKVALPDYLAAHPYLQEYYGTVQWGVRAVVDYYLGWFEGRASKLNPLNWREQAQRLVALAGGPDAAVAHARTAFYDNTLSSLQWALQLSEAVLHDSPEHAPARRLAAACLRFIGYQQLTANGRNYYLSEAARLSGQREYDMSHELQVASFLALPIDSFIYTLPLMLNTRQSDNVTSLAIALVLPTDAVYTVRVRRHVAELREYAPGAMALAKADNDEGGVPEPPYPPVDVKVRGTEDVLKTVILRPTSVPDLIAAGKLTLEPDAANGGLELLQAFAALFETPLRDLIQP